MELEEVRHNQPGMVMQRKFIQVINELIHIRLDDSYPILIIPSGLIISLIHVVPLIISFAWNCCVIPFCFFPLPH